MFNIVPEVSETIISSFHSILLFSSFFFPPFCLPAHLSSLLPHISASCILLLIPSRVFFNFSNMLFVSVCLFFISSSSLLNMLILAFSLFYFWDSESSLLSLLWAFFQLFCLFPLHLFGLVCCVFLGCYLCSISLPFQFLKLIVFYVSFSQASALNSILLLASALGG